MSNALLVLHCQHNVRYRASNIISRLLSKQTAYEQSKRGEKHLITSSLKAAANSNTQVPFLSEHREQKSSSVWKHTFNLTSGVTKLIPKDNGGYSSTSASPGRKRGKGLQSKKQRKGGSSLLSLASQEAEQETTTTQCWALAIPSAKTTEIKQDVLSTDALVAGANCSLQRTLQTEEMPCRRFSIPLVISSL